MQDRYAQCSRPKSIAHKGHYAKVGWQCPPTRVAKRGSVRSLRGLSPDSLATLALRGAVRSLRGVFVPRCGKIASAKAQAHKEREQLPARRARLGCDCSSLSPLTLKPLRSPTPCPFTAIATAFYVRLRRTRGSAVNGHGYGGYGSWLQRRQPSTMSAGCFPGFDTCGAPPPSRSLRGWFLNVRRVYNPSSANISTVIVMLLKLAITAIFILLLTVGYGFYFFKSLVADNHPLTEKIQELSQQNQAPNANPTEK